jgi:hypothetical protein
MHHHFTPDLLKPAFRRQWTPANPSYGFCYIASEALWHTGAREQGYVPHCGRDDAGVVHWWLQRVEDILDPTADQYLSQGLTPPYARGRGCGFLTRQPSKRAQTLIERMSA